MTVKKRAAKKTVANKMSLITLSNQTSPVVESYKMFRTNLNYTGIDKSQQVIMFTSSISEEGKTTSISNLAITYAQSGKKTLLIECDLRKARIHELFDLPKEPGLTTVLAGGGSMDEVIHTFDEIENLYVLTAGLLPPSPSEIVGSKKLYNLIKDVRKEYDVILIDTPPVLVVSDALALNKAVDGVVLIVAANETKKKALMNAKKSLDQVGANILGVLMTKVDLRKGKYYNYAYDSYYTGNKKKKILW
jgi:protein-tyrosine kinase